MTFDIRSGVTGYCAPYDPAGVKLMANGRIRLTATKTRSAGLLGPQIDWPCMIEVETSGRLCALHPLAVFAIWTWNDDTRDEIDIIEATWWHDPNKDTLYHWKHWPGGKDGLENHATARSYSRHRFTCEISGGMARCVAYGWQFDHWHEIGRFSAPFQPGQLRIALWTHAGIKDALGPCSVVLERVDIRAASVT